MEKYYGWGLPFNASTHGAQIDQLIYFIHILMFVLFAGWATFIIYTLIRFRARPGHKATYHLGHYKTPTYLEIIIALLEVMFLVGFSFPILHKMRNEMPPVDQSLQVRIVGEQFAWNIHYPGADGKFGKTDPKLISTQNAVGLDKTDPNAADDITTINQLHIPVNKPIIVHLSTKDVIHSFFLPVMRVKQDAIPGQEIPVWFEANKTGKFEIACAQLCGLGHYRMRGFFVIEPAEAFTTWQNTFIKKPAPPPAVTVQPVTVTPTTVSTTTTP